MVFLIVELGEFVCVAGIGIGMVVYAIVWGIV